MPKEVDDVAKVMERFKPNQKRKPANSGKERTVVHQHGLISPDATPVPDEAWFSADREQEQQEGGNRDDDNSFSALKSPHPASDDEDMNDAAEDRNWSAVAKKTESKKSNDGSGEKQRSQTDTQKMNEDVKKSKKILKGLGATRQDVGREKKGKGKDYTETQEAAVEQVMNAHAFFIEP